MTELPPLKEVYIAPPPPSAVPLSRRRSSCADRDDVRGRAEGRREAEGTASRSREKAIKEIKGVPPKLMLLCDRAEPLALILVIGIGVTIYIHSLNSDDDSGAARPAAVVRDSSAAGRQPASAQESASAAPAGRDPAGRRAARAAKLRRAQPVPTSEQRAMRKEEGGGCTRRHSRAAGD